MPVVIKMKGLPFEATSKDIQIFFDGLYLREDDIHLAAYKDGKASGIAFAVFHNDDDARLAMFRNEKFIGKRYIELFLSSSTEMAEMLDGGVPDPKPSRHQLVHQQRPNEPRDTQRTRNFQRDDQSRSRIVPDRRGLQENRGGNDGRTRQDSRAGERMTRQENRGGDDGRIRQENRGGNDRMRQDNRGGDRISQDIRGRDRMLRQENRGSDDGRIRQENRGGNDRMRQEARGLDRVSQDSRGGDRISKDNRGGDRVRQDNRAGIRQENRGNERGRPENRVKDDRRVVNRSRSRSPRQDNYQRSRGVEREGNNFKDRNRPSGHNRSVSQDERHVEITSNIPNVFERMGRGAEQLTGMFVNDNTGFGELFGSQARFAGHAFGNSFGNGDNMRQKSFRVEERKQVSDPPEEMVCVHLTELPFVISERDVRYFFKGLDIVQVKFLYHCHGRFAGKKTGEGFVEFQTVQDAMQAEKKHREKIGKRFVDVKAVTKIEMLKAIEKNELEMRHAKLEESKESMSGRASDLHVKVNPNVRMQEPSTSRMLDRGLDTLGMNMPQPGPYIHSVDPYDAQTQAVTTLNKLATTANIDPGDVAAGCVVGIRNLPSSITADEILNFFYGYAVYRDSVRIHYLAPGRSSGDAMVTLRNSQEAAAAIQGLNHKHVGKRSIQLFLV